MVPYSMFSVIKSSSFASQKFALKFQPKWSENVCLLRQNDLMPRKNFIKTNFLLIYTSLNEVVELKIHNHAFRMAKNFLI